MNENLRKQMEEMATVHADEDDLPGLSGGPRRVAEIAFEAGFLAASEIYEAKLQELIEHQKATINILAGIEKKLADVSQVKRCSHGMDLEYRCFICDQNTGVENRK